MRPLMLLLALPLIAAIGLSPRVQPQAPVASPSPSPSASVQASPSPVLTLRVEAPAEVPLGASIPLTFTAHNAVDLAGYEVDVLFDSTDVSVAGLQQRDNALRSLGRDVAPLGPIEHEHGVSLGLFTCPAGDCVSRTNWVQPDVGGNGEIYLGTLTLTTRQPGTVELVVHDPILVSVDGTPMAVPGGDTRLSVRVGASDTMVAFPAPAVPTASVVGAPPGPGGMSSLDLSQDGRVDFADAMEVALAWTRARTLGARCGSSVELQMDVDGDGCVTVADAQRIAAGFTRVVTNVPGTRHEGTDVLGSHIQP